MKTIITEKPSVAREIACIVGATKREEGYFEGGGYAVTWAFGHLVQLAMPDGYGIRGFVRDNLPVIPETFTLIPRQTKTEKGYKPDSGVTAQIKVIARLFNGSEQIVVATDAGREGELIFRYLYHYIGCSTPFVRLWISSLTDKAIREGLRNLENGSKYDNLFLAAKARSESDWLVGINGTQALTIAAGHGTYSVGRVQTPTLGMVCERYWENRRFTPEAFWQLHIAVNGNDNDGTVKLSSSGKWKEKEPATALYNKVKEAGTATVTKVERKEKTEETPLLFDLTTLQKEANAKHGFTAEQTLGIAQKLYEKKLITYPRTGSRYIPEDVFSEIPKLLAFIGAMPEWKGKVQAKAQPARRSVDGSKVTDHHAIIPTVEVARTDLSELPSGERDVLTLLAVRLLCATTQANRFEAVTAILDCQGHTFTAKGKTILQSGWKEVERIHRMSIRQSETEHRENEDAALPVLKEGQIFENVSASLREGKTSPPKHYTEDTLLSAMESAGKEDMPDEAERKGLGTPATRAAMIEKLLSAGFVERKGKSLVPTKDGVNLAVILPDMLKSPQLTAEWESRLTEIAKGSADPDEFMDGIADLTRELVKAYSHITEDGKKLFAPEKEAIGICPRCKSPVYEGKKNYYCSDRSCRFVMWKNDKFFESRKTTFSKKIAAALLKDGKAKVKGLYSERTGKTYDGTVLLCDTGDKYVNYRIEQTK